MDKPKTKAQLTTEIIARRNAILEQFTQAYIAHTKLGVDEIQLVQRQVEGGVEWNFEPKSPHLKTIYEQNLEAKVAKLKKGLMGLRRHGQDPDCWCPQAIIAPAAMGHTPLCKYISGAME